MKKATTNAAAPNSDKGTKKNGIISETTAKIVIYFFGTPIEKMPIKKEASDETI